jgi:hypothetical protein
MQFIRIGQYLGASQITGPKHNLLQVRVESRPQAEHPLCERLPPVGQCVHEPLIESELVSAVLEGVRKANRRLGASYSVTHIRYVQNDTKPEIVYGYMVLKLLEHFHSGGEFPASRSPTI